MPELALAEAASNLCRWPDGNVPWTLTQLLPGFSESQMVAMLQPYFQRWNRVKVWYVQHASEARVLVGCRHIDGQNGVLADCFLPCGNVKSVKLSFDIGEKWNPAFLGQVAWHEFGHALGISHAPANSPNIMAPSLNMGISSLGQWDLAEEKKRYPTTMPPPLPPTKVVLDFRGEAKSVAARIAGRQIVLEVEGAITDVVLAGGTLPPPIIPVPDPGGGMGGLLDFLSKIGPILDLLKDPRFLELIDLIISLFGGKKTLTADDVNQLATVLSNKAQAMRAAP